MTSFRTRLAIWSTLIGLCVLTALAYWQGLSGPFVFDDYNNIVDNSRLRIESMSPSAFWQATLAGDAGPLKRPLSMLTFAANYLISGLSPFPYKLTNLCIHALNGVLVFMLSRRLLAVMKTSSSATPTARDAIALAATGVWLLHPVQLTSVLYVVQRMTSLSATFVLLGLLVFMKARQQLAPRMRLTLLWIGVPFCGFLAAMAKENGLLLFAYAYVIESAFFRYARLPDERWGTAWQFFALTVALPLLVLAGYLLLHPEWFAHAAANRAFSVGERLWTESRVLFLYLQLLLVPAISNMALFYDDFPISYGWITPPTTLVSILALAVALGAAVVLRPRFPWFTFAVLWYLAGHAMESTIVNLELIHPHRNYVAFIGPILALTIGGAAVLRSRRARIVTAVTLITILAMITGLRAQQWRHPLDLAAYEVIHRPDSPRANYEIARLLHLVARRTGDDELKADAIRYLRKSAALSPTEISSLIGIVIANDGVAPPDILEELQRRLRSRPMGLNQVSYLHSLLNCQREKLCRNEPAQIQAIFGALLGQPALRPHVKADAVTMLGIYYLQQLGDVGAGVRMMREAVSLQPEDAQRYINLAQALMFEPDVAGADAALTHAAALDLLGAHRERLLKLRTDLTRMAKLQSSSKPSAQAEPRRIQSTPR